MTGVYNFMPDYQKLYTTLFSRVTDAIELLQRAQQETEELYLQEEPPLHLISETDQPPDGPSCG